MKKCLYVESRSIGDNIAAIPYLDMYRDGDTEIYVSINDNLIQYFEKEYPLIKFVARDRVSDFSDIQILRYDFNKSVQGGYAFQLGFDPAPYIRPRMDIPTGIRPIKGKYIAIGVHSTAQLKYWNHPKGKRFQPESTYWNELCGMIRKAGYTPVVVERDELFGAPPFFNGLPSKSNKKWGQSFNESMNLIYHSEFYIGISSGMSWVAHALGKRVAMIANFTEDWNEFDLSLPDYKRITNKSVCHGCWNKIGIDHGFDGGDWYWCPKHKDTDRQFECHTSITPERVFEEIKDWL